MLPPLVRTMGAAKTSARNALLVHSAPEALPLMKLLRMPITALS
jgi:hypothetical protein